MECGSLFDAIDLSSPVGLGESVAKFSEALSDGVAVAYINKDELSKKEEGRRTILQHMRCISFIKTVSWRRFALLALPIQRFA